MIFGSSLILFFTHIETHKRKSSLFSVPLCIFLLVTIIVSQSRGAFGIALLLAFLMLLLSKLTIKIKTIFSVILLIFIIGIFSIKTIPIISKQLNNINSHDIFGVGERFEVWNAALEVSRLNPLLGIGGGNWNPRLPWCARPLETGRWI
jgi:O-antigen ligase